MTQSDITIERLADVGAGDAAYLVSKIRTIPGFNKEGIKSPAPPPPPAARPPPPPPPP